MRSMNGRIDFRFDSSPPSSPNGPRVRSINPLLPTLSTITVRMKAPELPWSPPSAHTAFQSWLQPMDRLTLSLAALRIP